MKKNPSIRINYILNTCNQVMTLIVPLITAPYLSRVLGADGIGIQSYTNSIITYFVLVAVLGSSSFGQRNIAYYRDNKEKLSQAFWEVVILRVITSLVTLGTYYFIVLHNDHYQVIFIILSINILNVVFDINWFYQGIEQFKRIVIRSVIIRLIQTIFIFVFIKNTKDLKLYILFVCLFTLLGNASMWIGIKKYLTIPEEVKPFRNFKEVVLLFLPTVATQVYVVLDKSMIGWVTGSTYENGCYEQAERIARMVLTIVTSLSTVILPRVANLYKKQELDKAKEYLYIGYRFVWLLSLPMMFGLIAISSIFVPVFFGKGYDLVEILLPIFSILIVAVSLAHITGYAYLIPTEQQNIYTISVTIAAIVNLFMNLILIKSIGSIGAAIGSITAELIGITIQLSFCIKQKQLDSRNIFEGVPGYVTSSIFMLIVLMVVKKCVPTNAIGVIILVTFGVAVYVGGLLMFGDEIVVSNLKKIRKYLIKS